jgi:hypothetical protein
VYVGVVELAWIASTAKLLYFETWMVYVVAPLIAFQLKVGLRLPTVAPFNGRSRVGASNLIFTLRTLDQSL